MISKFSVPLTPLFSSFGSPESEDSIALPESSDLVAVPDQYVLCEKSTLGRLENVMTLSMSPWPMRMIHG